MLGGAGLSCNAFESVEIENQLRLVKYLQSNWFALPFHSLYTYLPDYKSQLFQL